MNKLIQYFVDRSFVVNILSIFFVFAGITLGSTIKRDIIPPFEWKSVNVRISLPGASATEVEKFIAYPVENSLKGLPHSKEIETTSESGTFRATVYFRADHDEMQESIEMIRSRINGIAWQLPEQSRDIIVEQNKVDSIFHMGIALENFDETNIIHRQIAQRLADQITEVQGIIRTYVNMNGQNLYIKLRPKKLIRNEISIAEVRQKVRQALTFSPIGQVDFNEKTFSIEVERPAEAIETFKRLATRGNRTGDVLYLEELADIQLEIDEIKERHRFNGNRSINLYTRKDIQSDSILLKGKVQRILDDANKNFPNDLKATVFLDQPQFIERQIEVLNNNAIFGMMLVLIILTMFFNWKVSLVTSFGIPIAYCGTLIAMYFLGLSIDMVSVVGMIMVLGILVDDAIIIAERYVENLEEGLAPRQAAVEASRDLMLPVTGTVLTTVFAFAPMVLVTSEIARVFYAIPIVIITSLIMSWLESFFILPNHLQHFVKSVPQRTKDSSLFLKTKALYRSILSLILRMRYVVVIFLVAFFAVSGWVAKNKIQQSFNFHPARERIAIKVTLKDNKSLAFTEKTVSPIEQYLMSLPKEKFSATNTDIGRIWSQGRLWKGYRYAKILLHISDEVERPSELKKEYTKILKKKLKDFKTDAIEKIVVGHEMNDQDEMKKNMVTIDVAGNEDVDYLELKTTIESQLKKLDTELELVKESNEFDEKWVFKPNTKRLAQHQMNLSTLTSQLRSFFVPHELMQIRMNGETKWIYTQVEREKTIRKSELNRMSVMNNIGLSVPLNSLGSWSKKKQLARVKHRDGKRMFSFDLSYEPTETMNVVKAKEHGQIIKDFLAKKFPTYAVELKDADRAEASSRAWALKVALLCIVLVMFTLALILGSVTLPFIVGLPIPFGLMGIVWALYLHDEVMGIMSLIGLIGTVGVSVNDSLIMVDQIMKRGRKNGGLTRDHILDGASSRLRAITLTTVTTIGGVAPMAYGIGGESSFTAPLAFSLGWGLFFSTFLTLFALPAFIEIRRDIGFGRIKISNWVRKKMGKESIEQKVVLKPATTEKPGLEVDFIGDQPNNDEPPQANL